VPDASSGSSQLVLYVNKIKWIMYVSQAASDWDEHKKYSVSKNRTATIKTATINMT